MSATGIIPIYIKTTYQIFCLREIIIQMAYLMVFRILVYIEQFYYHTKLLPYAVSSWLSVTENTNNLEMDSEHQLVFWLKSIITDLLKPERAHFLNTFHE